MTRTATGTSTGPVTEKDHRTPVLLSVNVGLPKNVAWRGKTVYTGIWKHPVPGPVTVRRLNIDGDGQGDLNGHGGEQRAVLVYQIQSYEYWQRYFGREDFSYGTFGENLTEARPDAFAVSPAIGPLPAIYVPPSPSQATAPSLLWHATVRAGGWVECCRGGS